ncbi:hypothetical protein B0H11DRAFT_1918310 [Mycena galericulata]|nr:hypothetical protein B0H11DRAFT_1918310 [Mycena galericulata]
MKSAQIPAFKMHPRHPVIEYWNSGQLNFQPASIHSRQYRRPQPFTNETLIVVGSAVSDLMEVARLLNTGVQLSGVEITWEINPTAWRIYQSVRPPNPLMPYDPAYAYLNCLPANVSIVPEIRRFHATNASIELANGTFLHDITRVVFATGYRYSFPFLPQFHNSSTSMPDPIVTDGTHLRFLHEDFLYIAEPTIGFLNMNWGVQTFMYAEYLSLALAKIWASKAILPGTETMWRIYDRRVKDHGGSGRHLHFLGAGRAAETIRFFVGWLNGAAVEFGGRQIDGESKEVWHGCHDVTPYP